MTHRPKIPESIADKLIFANDHTCCICRVKGKHIQIHHIDSDNSNNIWENLAVLCLDCHSKATGDEGLGRRITAGEIKEYKRTWESIVKKKLSGEETTKADFKHEELITILTAMHDRMIYLKEERLKQRFGRKRFEDACPLFFDQLGIVKANEWETFERRVAKRIKHHVPKNPEKKAKMMWRYKVVGEAKEIVQELVNSRDWQIEDLVKAGGHLDGIHMGLGELRNNDKEWQSLFKIARPYRTDPVLRGLIDNYLSLSYAFCSVLLVTSYGNKLAKHDFGRMLCSALTSSNISPDKIEIALGEILEKINERLKAFNARPLFPQSK
jgi:hypothetical protein